MTNPLSVVIIGAGFGGIGMAIQLKKAGFHDLVILEKADDLGGTWRDNTYPGAACDVPSHLYSFSFERKADWSRKYPPQAEILDYLRHCARKYDVLRHIRFGVEVAEAEFAEGDGLWRVRTTSGEEISSRVMVSACGQLNRPAHPDIPGLDGFAGTVFHSARWDHAYDPTGKQVAVIGTGASAIQFVPPIAEQAAQVHLFQRSAPYVIAKPDRPYPRWEQQLLRFVPPLQKLSRAKLYALHEARALGFVSFPHLMDRIAEKMFRPHLEEQVEDPELRRALTPDYVMGCKRILISSDYYPAITRPNVELVTDRIERIEPHAVVTDDGEKREVDTIILGTGFQSTDFLAPMRIVGLGGLDLNEAWRDGAEAYLGIAVSRFPNLFLLYGPNTNLGHNSIIYMLESQVHYVLQCIQLIRRRDLTYIDIRPDVQDAFNHDLQERFRSTVWDTGCTSWYKTAGGKITNNWPGFTLSYRRATRRPNLRHFRARAT